MNVTTNSSSLQLSIINKTYSDSECFLVYMKSSYMFICIFYIFNYFYNIIVSISLLKNYYNLFDVRAHHGSRSW